MVVASLQASITAFMFCFIFIFGSFLNGWIVYTFLKLRRTLLFRPQDVMIVSLAIGDFVTSFFVCPLGFSSAIAQYWLWSDTGCVLYAFTTTWVGLTSVIKLVLLAVERFIAFRSSTPNIVTVQKTCQAVLISWLLTFLVCCAPLTGFVKVRFRGYRGALFYTLGHKFYLRPNFLSFSINRFLLRSHRCNLSLLRKNFSHC